MVEWKDIKDFEGLYQVSSDGQIKSLAKSWICGNKKSKRFKAESIMKLSTDTSGYKSVCLSKNKISKTHNVHRLVAIAFIENPENKKCVNHINGDKSNNNIKNLEWVTHSENTIHAFSNNLNKVKFGENHAGAKLTEKDIINIRKRCNEKKSIIAKEYNVTIQNISRIMYLKTWKHL